MVWEPCSGWADIWMILYRTNYSAVGRTWKMWEKYICTIIQTFFTPVKLSIVLEIKTAVAMISMISYSKSYEKVSLDLNTFTQWGITLT